MSSDFALMVTPLRCQIGHQEEHYHRAFEDEDDTQTAMGSAEVSSSHVCEA